jgi:hypothetical protein
MSPLLIINFPLSFFRVAIFFFFNLGSLVIPLLLAVSILVNGNWYQSPFTIVSGTDVTMTMVDIPEWQPGGGAQDEGVIGLEYHNKQEAAKY